MSCCFFAHAILQTTFIMALFQELLQCQNTLMLLASHVFASTTPCSGLPGISWLKLTLRKGPLVLLKSRAVAVMEMLLCTWTFWITPLEQNSPTDCPSSSDTLTETIGLHSCPGRDCWRLPVGDISSTVPSSGMLTDQVKLWRGIGRQDSSLGTVREVGGHDATSRQSVNKKAQNQIEFHAK